MIKYSFSKTNIGYTVMQVVKLLHNMLKKELSFIHKIRLNSLMDVVKTATTTNKLYLTGLGRSLINKCKTGSNIQKVDRLVGNNHLHKERIYFYKVMLATVIKENSAPWVHIDWTCLNSTTNLYALRASVSMSGRSLVIYEESHPKKKENNHATHKAFLNKLKELLPVSVRPVIVTDAGFRAPWFAYILSLGWDFVGRLRNKNLIKTDEPNSDWKLSHTFFSQATDKPTHKGKGLLTKDLKVPVNFVLYKGPRKNRHNITKNKKVGRGGMNKRYSKANKEPWLLVTSLDKAINNPNQSVIIYKQRMRIEENIRDTKCPNYGLGLKKSLSRTVDRMNVLLLIAALTTFVAWLAGIYTVNIGKAADFQAHSAKIKSALSKVYLGREAIKRGLNITKRQFLDSLNQLHYLCLSTQQEAL